METVQYESLAMHLKENGFAVTPKRKSMELHKQPFRMDGKEIVCNVCGEKFTNLVLFGNHTHSADQKQSNMPAQRRWPKPHHKTFNTMSEQEMLEAFHKMPELEGCWIKNGRYICNMCGKSCPNPYVLFSHKIIHPSDMTPFSRVKETDSLPTQVVATQTTVDLGFRGRKRNQKRNLIKDQGTKVLDSRCESAIKDVEGDGDDNVQNVMKLAKPMKKLKVMNIGKQMAKPQETLLYKTLISVDNKSTAVTSKPPSEQIVMEPGKKSKPSAGGDRTDLAVSSDSEDEEDGSMSSDSDDIGDSIWIPPEMPNQKLGTCQFKKRKTHLYKSLIAVKGHRANEKRNNMPSQRSGPNPDHKTFNTMSEEEMVETFHKMPELEGCRIINGRYVCNMCGKSFPNPYLLFSHKIVHPADMTPCSRVKETDSKQTQEILNHPGRPNQKVSPFKKKGTHVYRSLISVKGQSFVKPIKPPPYEYCVNMFGHKFLDNCKLMKGKYYCDECPSLYSSFYLLLNHKLYHAKHKYLNKKRAAQEGTASKKEEAQMGTRNRKNELEVGTTDKEEEAHIGTTDKEEEARIGTTDKEEKAWVGTIDKEEETQVEEDGMCFECNMCQVKFYSSDGLADHIEAHAADTQAFSDSACADISKVSTSACITEMSDDSIVVKVKEEPVTGYEDDQTTNEPQSESSGLDPGVKMKQETEPFGLPQHATKDLIQRDGTDVHLEDKLFLKRQIFSPVVRLKRIEIEANEVYIVK